MSLSNPMNPVIVAFVAEHHKVITAIKLIREHLGVGLREAKEMWDKREIRANDIPSYIPNEKKMALIKDLTDLGVVKEHATEGQKISVLSTVRFDGSVEMVIRNLQTGKHTTYVVDVSEREEAYTLSVKQTRLDGTLRPSGAFTDMVHNIGGDV